MSNDILLDIHLHKHILVLTMNDIDSFFYVLKPHLLNEMVTGLKACSSEAQVMIYIAALVAMGALEIC